MTVNLDVSRRLHGEIEQAAPSDLLEHVREEGHGCGDLTRPGAVEVDLDRYRGLLGGPRFPADSHPIIRTWSKVFRQRLRAERPILYRPRVTQDPRGSGSRMDDSLIA